MRETERREGTQDDRRTELSGQDARQGEIILGKWGRWIWIGAFAAILILALVFGL